MRRLAPLVVLFATAGCMIFASSATTSTAAASLSADAIPSSNLPSAGQIDLAEGNLDGTICGVLHPEGAISDSDRDVYCTSSGYSSWHTAVVEWTPSSVSFFLDDQLIGQSTNRIPSTPMHLVLQTETLSGGQLPSTSAKGYVYIDWVAAYQPAASLPAAEPMPVGDLPGWRQVFSDDF